MADNVNLNYSSPTGEAYIDYIWPILFPDINLDNTVGSSRLLNNAFGTWVDNNDDLNSISITDVILDIAYSENNFGLNISFNANVVTDEDLIFNASFNTSISHEFDTWSYLATNPDLIFSIGTDKGRVAQHYLQSGINEGRTADDFNENEYVASNQDLIPIFGLNPKEAIQHYVEFGFNEQRPTSDFNESVYLAANLDILNVDYSSYYRYENLDIYPNFFQLEKYAQAHYINFGYLEGRDSNLNTLIKALSGHSSNFKNYSNSVLNSYAGQAQGIVLEYLYFDRNSYVASNQDLLNYPDSKLELYYHYLNYGRGESRSLDSFDEFKYLVANHDLINSFGSNGKSATEHYVDQGISEGRSSEFNIFLSGYLVSNPDILDSLYEDVNGLYNNTGYSLLWHDLNYSNLYSSDNNSGYDYSKHSSLTHYFGKGYLENREFNTFDNSNYLNYLIEAGYYYSSSGENYFSKSSGYSVLSGTFSESDYEKVASHFIYDYINFDDSSYLASNSDLISNMEGINSKFNIFNHYITFGYAEGRNLDDFDEYQYLASHHDLILAFGLNNISSATEHYVQRGFLEGRYADNFNEWGYLNKNNDLRSLFGNNHYEATKHYVENGFREGRSF